MMTFSNKQLKEIRKELIKNCEYDNEFFMDWVEDSKPVDTEICDITKGIALMRFSGVISKTKNYHAPATYWQPAEDAVEYDVELDCVSYFVADDENDDEIVMADEDLQRLNEMLRRITYC